MLPLPTHGEPNVAAATSIDSPQSGISPHATHTTRLAETENRKHKTEHRTQKTKHRQRAETRFLTSANVNKASLPMLSSSAVLNASLSLPCIVTKHAPPGYQPTP
jgi:hypothetical protein